METYLIYIDENGEYKSNRKKNFKDAHPFFIRSCLMITSKEWKESITEFFSLKNEFNIPKEKELKWSYLWSLKKYKDNNKKINKKLPLYFFRNYDHNQLLKFIERSEKILFQKPSVKYIFTVTDNKNLVSLDAFRLHKMHLEDILERLEMELQTKGDLGIIFIDEKNKRHDQFIKKAYKEIYSMDSYISKFKHLKDTMSVEISSHSFGIQMADYAAGIFSGFLRDFKDSKSLFNKYIRPKLRRNPLGKEIIGYGIKDTPRCYELRKQLDTILS